MKGNLYLALSISIQFVIQNKQNELNSKKNTKFRHINEHVFDYAVHYYGVWSINAVSSPFKVMYNNIFNNERIFDLIGRQT